MGRRVALILHPAGMLSLAGPTRRADSDGSLRRTATLMAVAGLVFAWGPGPCRRGTGTVPAVTTRVEAGSAGVALRARLLHQGEWGRGVAVMAAGDARDSPLAVVLGVETRAAVAGPVAGTGAWRELAAPHGHAAGSTVFMKRPGCACAAASIRARSVAYSCSRRRGSRWPDSAALPVPARPAGRRSSVWWLRRLPARRCRWRRMARYVRQRRGSGPRPGCWRRRLPRRRPGTGGVRLGLSARCGPVGQCQSLGWSPRAGRRTCPGGGTWRPGARRAEGRDIGSRARISRPGRRLRWRSRAWALRFQGAAGASAWKLKYRLDARGEELVPVWPSSQREEPSPRELALAVPLSCTWVNGR